MNKTYFKHISKFSVGVAVLVLHFALQFCFSRSKSMVDGMYQLGIFRFFRKGFDQTIGQLDFPFIYLLLPILVILTIWDIYRKRKDGILSIMAFLFNYAVIFYFLFYLFWAYNYQCTSLESRMNMPVVDIDRTYLIEELEALKPVIEQHRSTLSMDVLRKYHPKTIEDFVRPELRAFLSDFGYYTETKARVKRLHDGFLMRLRTSGIYIPYVFEGHFDGSIHRIQWAFTITHEMAHAYGVTDEKECNFAAYIACLQSDNPYVVYSALIAHWRYLAFALLKEDREAYSLIRDELSEEVKNDLDEINEAITQYPELLPNSRDRIYDSYLKNHGIKEGIVSYDKMIEMIASWNEVRASLR